MVLVDVLLALFQAYVEPAPILLDIGALLDWAREIKFKETIRTCLNQTGAKVSLNWARAISQRTASLGEAVSLRRPGGLPEAPGGFGGAQAVGPAGRGAGRPNLENSFPNRERNLLNWRVVKNLTQNPIY